MKNLNTVFPFYDSPDEQCRYIKGINRIPFIICPTTKMVPWIIRRPHNSGTIANIFVSIISVNSGATVEKHAVEFGISITPTAHYDFISYTGDDLDFQFPYSTGGYYLDVFDDVGNKHWYSEIFSMQSEAESFTYLTFKNDTETDRILAGFTQGIYIDTMMIAPVYTREDEGEKRDGLLVKEKQIKLKAKVVRYQLIPEYLTDALIRLDMQDSVSFTVNDEITTVLQVVIKEPEWLAEGYGIFAKMEIQLIYDVEIKKLNFKETGYKTEGIMGTIIKQGIGSTVPDGDSFTLQVLFEDQMPDITYTPVATAKSVDDYGDAQPVICINTTVHGFLIVTPVMCEVKWTAIYVP